MNSVCNCCFAEGQTPKSEPREGSLENKNQDIISWELPKTKNGK